MSANTGNSKVSLSVRIPTELHDRLHAAAQERVVSVNLLVNATIIELLDDLIPVDELRRSHVQEFTPPAQLLTPEQRRHIESGFKP